LRDEDDSSTLSSSSSTSRQSKDSSTRSRGRSGRPRRRKRQQLSPVGSIKSSASLIELKSTKKLTRILSMRLAKTKWVMLTLSDAQNLLQSHEEEASPRQVGQQVKPVDVIPLLNKADDSSTPEIEKVSMFGTFPRITRLRTILSTTWLQREKIQ
jgi:hypothetical protein